MSQILESQIQEEIQICPYCGSEAASWMMGCCGESKAHFEKAFKLYDDDEVYLESEVEIIKEEAR